MISTVLGGVGLFLIGMVLMTEGMQAAAGDALKRTLARFTGGPLSSMLAGAGATLLVQSSSATTLTTIGFVSAGLLTFPQSLGVILGANIGTTGTGWLVALFGLKMSILPLAMPLVGIGALLRLLARGKVASLGLALAGFGLIFVGIATLQTGMADAAQFVQPSQFPSGGIGARLLLLLLGFAMTVVMQSSSAAVATTLAALSSGTIDISQAAALVVGQNVGTTVTAALAAVGAAVAARRTALAHVLFNLLVGGVGFALVPVFVLSVSSLQGDLTGGDAAIALAAFHTVMNLAGVLLVWPFLRRFADLVARLMPDRGPHFGQHLDRSVSRVAAVAVEAARRTLIEILAWSAGALGRSTHDTGNAGIAPAESGITEVRRFLATIRADEESQEARARHVSALHAIDHLQELVHASSKVRLRVGASRDPALAELHALLKQTVAVALQWCEAPMPTAGVESGQLSAALGRGVQSMRSTVLAQAADGHLDTEEALARLDAMRWMESVAYHLHRALVHLAEEQTPTSAPATA
jgi:phosphate:Na+ symporter